MGLGLSVIDKLVCSLGFRQTHLETYKSIIYDSSSVPDMRLTSFYFYIMYIGLQNVVFTLS